MTKTLYLCHSDLTFVTETLPMWKTLYLYHRHCNFTCDKDMAPASHTMWLFHRHLTWVNDTVTMSQTPYPCQRHCTCLIYTVTVSQIPYLCLIHCTCIPDILHVITLYMFYLCSFVAEIKKNTHRIIYIYVISVKYLTYLKSGDLWNNRYENGRTSEDVAWNKTDIIFLL